MSSTTLQLNETIHNYLLENSLRESAACQQLREETNTLSVGTMQVSPEQGQFMALLVELTGTRKAVEVGTFTGYSALCVAQALPEGGTLVCCDVSEEWTGVGRSTGNRLVSVTGLISESGRRSIRSRPYAMLEKKVPSTLASLMLIKQVINPTMNICSHY